MKSFYENLATDELLKKRALGSEALTPEAHEIISIILKERNVEVPPLYEKPIDIDEMSTKFIKEKKWSNIDSIQTFLWLLGSVLASEFLKAILKNSGFIINIIFCISTLIILYFLREHRSGIPVEGELADIVGKDGFNELMMCSALGNNERIKEILSYKPDVDKSDIKGYTALMYAASNGKIEAVKLLLAYGANKNIKTKKGNKAISFAERNKHDEIVKLLT